MTVILVLLFAIAFLAIDHFKTAYDRKTSVQYRKTYRQTVFTTPGFEMLGALAQDGGERIDPQMELFDASDYIKAGRAEYRAVRAAKAN